MKRFLFAFALLSGILFSGVLPAQQPAEAQQPADRVRVFIDLPSNLTILDRATINSVGGEVRWEFATSNTISVEIPVQTLSYLQQFAGRFLNIRIEPTAMATEDTLDWGVDQINAEQVWGGAENAINVSASANGGAGIKVAVIDTGIDIDHPDLDANIKGGWNFITNTSSFNDDNGHGTHVSGTIAAEDNGSDVVGVAPKASLYGLKVLNASGSGSFGDIVKAIEWASGFNGGTKVDVINMSLGCYYAPQPSACDDPALEAAINAALNAGVLVVVAAGNDGSGTDTVGYPAQYAATLSVAATTSTNARASFSSTGPDVDVAAPGQSILSTRMGGGTTIFSGTSMATPHVAGLAALIKGAHPEWTAAQIRNAIESTATDLGTAGKDNSFGYGMVNAPAAVGVPSAPVGQTTAYAGCNGQAAVTTASGDNNGYESNPTNACADGGGHAQDNNSGTATSSSCTNSGKDRHVFSGFGLPVNSGSAILGIEVRLDAWADATGGSPKLCVQLSWDGGTTWTTAKQTATLTNSERTYTLGSNSDTWGRTWSSADFGGANFRVRIIDVASNTSRDFRLDWVAVRVTFNGGTTPLSETATPTPTLTPTGTPTATRTPTATPTIGSPTASPTATSTGTVTPTATPTSPSGCGLSIVTSSDTDEAGAGIVSFSWTAVPGASGYGIRIQSSSGSTTYNKVVSLSSSTTSWTSPSSGTGADTAWDAMYYIEARDVAGCSITFDPQ